MNQNSPELDDALERFNQIADDAIARIRTTRANFALKLGNAVGVNFRCGHGVQCLDLSPKQRECLARSLCPQCMALLSKHFGWSMALTLNEKGI